MMEKSAVSNQQDEVLLSEGEDEDTVEFEIEVVTSSVGSELSRNSSPDRDLDNTSELQQTEECNQVEEQQVEEDSPIREVLPDEQIGKQVQEANVDSNTATTNLTNEPDGDGRRQQPSPEALVEPEINSSQHGDNEDDSSEGIPVEVVSDQRLQAIDCPESLSARDPLELVTGDEGEHGGRCLEANDKDDLRGAVQGECCCVEEAGGMCALESANEDGDSCAGPGDTNQRELSALPSACAAGHVDQPATEATEATGDSGDECEQHEGQHVNEHHPSDWTLIGGEAEDFLGGSEPTEAATGEENEAEQQLEVPQMAHRKRRRQQSTNSNGKDNEDKQGADETGRAAAVWPSAPNSMLPVVGGLLDKDETSGPPPSKSDDIGQGVATREQADARHEMVASDCASAEGDNISVQFEELPGLIEVRAGALERRSSSMLVEASLEHDEDQQAVKETFNNDDVDEFQMAPGVGMASDESANLAQHDVNLLVKTTTSDQLSSSSSLHNLLNSDATCGFDEEDLEREFDEEPEFKQRQVEVKRNRNPRDEYELGEELGRGKFGTVFRCQERAGGLKLAAKFMHIRRREDRDDVEREVAIMSELQHKRLLQLYDAFDDGLHEMCLITELVEGGELFERIVDDDFDLTEKKAAIFMRQICEGAEYMHEKQIVHLDMKPENILCLSRTGNRIKLIDFGLARRLDPNKPIRVLFGTPDFAAPEVLAYETVQLATDMWSVGVICYVLLSGLSPFMGDSDMDTMANVMRATFDFNDRAFEAISELAKDFISKLLLREPDKRLKPSECLKHAWLQRGGAPLEAHIRDRRESSLSLLLEGHHRLALEQAAMLTAAATTSTTSPSTPPSSGQQQPNSANLMMFPTFKPRASFGAESSASDRTGHQSLDKRRLKKYVVRRKWHKTVHAIMALGRMGASFK